AFTGEGPDAKYSVSISTGTIVDNIFRSISFPPLLNLSLESRLFTIGITCQSKSMANLSPIHVSDVHAEESYIRPDCK
ncbi:hypothetical protein, partial [Desulforhopalus singaporensis]|uniref:hypothetical protein n=1 Tax=Desulforhopalus singaporensis TaxID=91360 RepID=UPI001C409B42